MGVKPWGLKYFSLWQNWRLSFFIVTFFSDTGILSTHDFSSNWEAEIHRSESKVLSTSLSLWLPDSQLSSLWAVHPTDVWELTPGPTAGTTLHLAFLFLLCLEDEDGLISPPVEFIISPLIGTIYITQCSVLQIDPFSARGSCAPQLCSGRGGGCLQHKMVERCRIN